MVLGFPGRPPRPRSDSASQFPTGGGSAPRLPLRASLLVPRAARPLCPRRPTYRARSPSHHLQRAPAASVSLGTLPASRALAGGHVTDGRRAPCACARPQDEPRSPPPTLRPGLVGLLVSAFFVERGGETGGCLKSELVHTLCLPLSHPKGEAREPCAVSSFGFPELQVPPRPREPPTERDVR